MAEFTILDGHDAPPPTIPKPDAQVDPYFVTVQSGVPVIYGEENLPVCGVRVVHPTNPNAPSVNHSIAMLYLPPHGKLPLHAHETEETYVIVTGTGTISYWNGVRDVGPGDFVYLPAWCEHGIENTGREPLVSLLATSPPNP
jgi:mannose-6-phosphate isomerase-like protein (cupin superfamily)